MAHITEPYFTRKKAGSGLGLFIVQRILHEHGGHLELLSQPAAAPPRASFCRWPSGACACSAAAKLPNPSREEEQAAVSDLSDNLPVLLVVEDEKNTRDGLRRYLRREV